MLEGRWFMQIRSEISCKVAFQARNMNSLGIQRHSNCYFLSSMWHHSAWAVDVGHDTHR